MSRNPQIWLITLKINGKREQINTPLLRYKWEAYLWAKQQRPTAEIVKIEPWRSMAVK